LRHAVTPCSWVPVLSRDAAVAEQAFSLDTLVIENG
jgi:hypothetical protein